MGISLCKGRHFPHYVRAEAGHCQKNVKAYTSVIRHLKARMLSQCCQTLGQGEVLQLRQLPEWEVLPLRHPQKRPRRKRKRVSRIKIPLLRLPVLTFTFHIEKEESDEDMGLGLFD